MTTFNRRLAVLGISSTIIATGIVQYDMPASVALECGLLTDGAGGAKWFAEWATKSPADRVYVYTFGGIVGGFIYSEQADFTTLAEFADCANTAALAIWTELQCAWDERLDAALFA
jgi:hypothetical protein